MDKELLGKRINEVRKERGYTVEDLAFSIGVHKSTISRYENGGIETPKMPVIESIGNELHVNPAWLIGKSSDKSYTPPNSFFSLYEPCNLFSPLKSMRKSRRLEPDDVAFSIGISEKDYLAIENGCNTDCITLAKIACFYCCSTDYALSFDGVSNESWYSYFLEHTLSRLHKAFGVLSASQQEEVIKYAESLSD